jgi:hypothetical protein
MNPTIPRQWEISVYAHAGSIIIDQTHPNGELHSVFVTLANVPAFVEAILDEVKEVNALKVASCVEARSPDSVSPGVSNGAHAHNRTTSRKARNEG